MFISRMCVIFMSFECLCEKLCVCLVFSPFSRINAFPHSDPCLRASKHKANGCGRFGGHLDEFCKFVLPL